MTGIEWFLLVLIIVCGFYMAWNIGANDVANAMGTSVGSKALTLKQAVILAGIFEFLGAYLVGANVSETVRKKIFDPELLTGFYGDQASLVLACGMIAALMAAGTWLMTASYFGWPVSTTHTIVGAAVGFGCVSLGFSQVAWAKVSFIAAGWIVSPLLSAAIAYTLFQVILRNVFYKKNPVAAAKRIAPPMVFITLVVLIGVATFKGLKPFWKTQHIDPFEPKVLLITAGVTIVTSMIGMFVTRRLVRHIDDGGDERPNEVLSTHLSRALGKAGMHLRRVRDTAEGTVQEEAVRLLDGLDRLHGEVRKEITYGTDSVELRKVERIFAYLQILTACFVAFSHGSNDVANAIGPLSAGYQAITEGKVALTAGVPAWALMLGGVGIITGLATWGWRVIRTVGERITELTPSRGFAAEFAAAITILFASTLPFGLPVSTTHVLVGAVLGVGLARGFGALNFAVMRDIVASWIITIPAGAGLSVLFYLILKSIIFSLPGA
ncbi:MAG: inorganic phosphate transporter [Pirellulales bacterium]